MIASRQPCRCYTGGDEHGSPATLTEALCRADVILVGLTETATNYRVVPYADQYRQANATIETPVEMLQRAADDQKRREARRQ